MIFNLNLENINYIKIIYKDRDGMTRCTKAAIKRMSEVDILACAKIESGLNIKTPQEVTISFVCENGLYRTTSTLKYIEIKDEFAFFAIKTPQGLDYQQNREYFRVRLSEPVIISYTKQETQNSILGKIYDISANGVRVILDNPEDIPNVVELTLQFKNRTVVTAAKRMRVDKEEHPYDVAFKFENIKSNDMDYISQICIQKQLEYKRNSIK